MGGEASAEDQELGKAFREGYCICPVLLFRFFILHNK
jgi:hypothetical protein